MTRILVLVALVACHARSTDRQAATAPQPDAATAPSLYDLPLHLRDASGSTIHLDVARGHVVLVSMFYASCPAACPVLVEELRSMLAAIGDRDVRVVLVSFDPARDTPERLRELATARHLDARWTLAAADDGDARLLSAALGIKYRKLADGSFSHTSAVVALDGDGRPIARMDRLGDHSDLVAAVSAARR